MFSLRRSATIRKNLFIAKIRRKALSNRRIEQQRIRTINKAIEAGRD